MATNIFVLNGPNLNLLGQREPALYGRKTLADIQKECVEAGKRLDFSVDFRQTNIEGELVGWIQEAGSKAKGVVLNAGAYTHTSIAIHDAIRGAGVPTIEVHLSNIFARESFRHHSYVSPVAAGVICGLGSQGYLLALLALKPLVDRKADAKAPKVARQ